MEKYRLRRVFEMIKVYGKENCSKCTSLKGILTDRNIEFEYIEDMKTLMIVASKECTSDRIQ